MDRRFLHETLAHDLDKIIDKKIAILGCGALGANLAISLARRGFNNFWLVDYDKIDEHNLSTQPWSMQDLGRNKASTLGTMLYAMTRSIADISPRKFESSKFFESDIYIDCFDNQASRKLAQRLAPYPVLHVGMSNQNTGEVTWNERYTVPHDVKLEDPCNYPLARTLIELTVVAASEAIIEFLQTGEKYDSFVNANTLQIRVKNN